MACSNDVSKLLRQKEYCERNMQILSGDIEMLCKALVDESLNGYKPGGKDSLTMHHIVTDEIVHAKYQLDVMLEMLRR